ncbi:hypothetical protein BH11BAC2_BH11BAC2_09230 [soil metagenome]
MLMFGGIIQSCEHDIPSPSSSNGLGNGNGGGNGSGTFIPCDPDSIYFEQQILPILVANCTMSGCHNTIDHQEGIDYSSFASTRSTGRVNPFNASSSKMYKSLIETDPGDRMPQGMPALTSVQIQLIATWINQGALDLHCSNGCDTTNVTYAGTIKPLIDNKCKGCHQGASPGGGVDLSTYAGIAASAANGSLLGSVQHNPNWSAMPKNSAQLPDCEIAQIRIWVNAGYSQ